MQLENLILTNFRCFKKLDVTFHHKLTVLVGTNGAGKTALLEGITTGFGALLTHLPQVTGKKINTDNDLRIINHNKQEAFVRLYLKLSNGIDWDRTEKRDKSKRTSETIPAGIGTKRLNEFADTFIDSYNTDQDFTLPIIAYYDTSRAVFNTPKRKRDFKKFYSRFEALDGCLERTTNFKRLFQWFDNMQIEENNKIKEFKNFDYQLPELKAVREAINRVMPEFSNPIIEEHPLRFSINQTIDNEVKTFHIEQLSDGFRITLAMIMDIAARMAEANPQAVDILSTPGIVIIDEVDLHLHPAWQQKILSDLPKAFPEIQFIVSTHSPQVLSTVSKQCIQVLGKNSDQQITISDIISNSYGEASNDLLETIMSVDPIPPLVEIEKLEELQILVETTNDIYTPEIPEMFEELKELLPENHTLLQELKRTFERRKIVEK